MRPFLLPRSLVHTGQSLDTRKDLQAEHFLGTAGDLYDAFIEFTRASLPRLDFLAAISAGA
jgi:hypothetical protein